MTDEFDIGEIPACLKRDPTQAKAATAAPADAPKTWYMPAAATRSKVTPAEKDAAALSATAAIGRGADTFGKVKKALPDIEAKKLRQAIGRAIRMGLVAREGKRYYRR